VSHSAVSQQVKQIEEYFGQRLFTRPGRRVEPTPAALNFLEDIRAAFDRIAVASEQLSHHGSHRILTVSATPSFAMRWLIPKTAVFQLENPTIELRVTTSASDGIAHLDKPFDLIIRRDVMERSGHVCRRLLDDISTPLASPGFLERRPTAEPVELLAGPLLHLRSRPKAWQSWFAQNGVDLPRTLGGHYFDHFFLSLQAAINGLGVAIGPYALVEEDLAAQRLIAVFPERTLSGPGFHILFRPDLVEERAGRTFMRWLEGETAMGAAE
jgi:LysR family glycine cleavage system transcriptional activator